MVGGCNVGFGVWWTVAMLGLGLVGGCNVGFGVWLAVGLRPQTHVKCEV